MVKLQTLGNSGGKLMILLFVELIQIR
jgi:hypothetical protein